METIAVPGAGSTHMDEPAPFFAFPLFSGPCPIAQRCPPSGQFFSIQFAGSHVNHVPEYHRRHIAEGGFADFLDITHSSEVDNQD